MNTKFNSESGQGLLVILLVIALIAIIGIVVGNALGVNVSAWADAVDGCQAFANAC